MCVLSSSALPVFPEKTGLATAPRTWHPGWGCPGLCSPLPNFKEVQNFVAQFIQLLKRWLYRTWSGVVVENILAPSVDQCRLQGLQFFGAGALG